MKSDRISATAQLLVSAAAITAVAILAASPFSVSDLRGLASPEAVTLLAALVILGLFDVSLPRGDSIDTTVPIAFVAALRLHPYLAVIVLLVAKLAVLAAKRPKKGWARGLSQTARRAALIAVTYAVLRAVAPQVLGSIGSQGLLAKLPWIVAGAVAFVAADLLAEQLDNSLRSGTPWAALITSTVRLQGSMLAAEMSTAALTVVLLPTVQTIAALTISVGLLLVIRQSFALLLEVRASYTSTVEVLARALEAYDPTRRGHAERVAALVASAGRLLGFQGKRLEDMSYAALFHDVGLLGMDDASSPRRAGSAQVLKDVGFLAGALPALQVLDAAGELEASVDEQALVGAYLIAWFSASDSQNAAHATESMDLANAIGTRLYATTRRAVDRAIVRVENESARLSEQVGQPAIDE